MKPRGTVLAVVIAASCAHQPGGTAEPGMTPLVGTWRLLDVVAVREDGTTVTSKWGPHPRGYIVYDRSGHMAAQISGDPRPKFGVRDNPTAEEGRAAYKSYLAYAGTYSFDPTRSVVTHQIEMSLDPSDVGKDLQREARLEGNHVVLLAQPYTLGGEQVRNRLTWERVNGP